MDAHIRLHGTAGVYFVALDAALLVVEGLIDVFLLGVVE